MCGAFVSRACVNIQSLTTHSSIPRHLINACCVSQHGSARTTISIITPRQLHTCAHSQRNFNFGLSLTTRFRNRNHAKNASMCFLQQQHIYNKMLKNKTGVHPYREFIMRRFLRKLRIWGPQPALRYGPQPHAFTHWKRKRVPTVKQIMLTAVTK